MDDREDPLPSFYHQLAIEPGQEVEAFYSRLVWAVDLTHDAWRDEHDERIAKLDALYSRHGLPSEPANFAAAIDLEERATAPAEPASETRTFENGGGLKLHAFSTDALDLVEPVALEVETNFYEFGSEEALVAHHQWSLQPHVKRLWALALAECARSGTVKLPSHWTPSTLYTTVNDGRVAATFRDGFGIFKIHLSPQLQCMQQYALLLFSDEPPPWILDRYGPQRGGNSAREQTALIAWDETVGLHARGNYPAAINALMVIGQLPVDHFRIGRTVKELIASPNPAVRHAVGFILGPVARPREVFESVTQQLRSERERLVLEHLIRAARIYGGEAALDALLQTALVSPSRYGRDAATRALAWVPNLADRGAHLMRLERDPDPLRAKVGSKALLEARNHTLFSREGEFASAFEHTLYDALKAFLQRGDADASQLLARALSAGALRLAVDGDPSQLGATAALVTYEGVPLHVEAERVGELLQRLAALRGH